MLGNIFPPFTTMQECNLDWILTKVKNILRFVPDDGQVGQILRRTRSGAEWSDEQGGGGAVNSVNGQTGTVVLTAADVGALPDSTTIPTNTSDLNNDSGFITAAQAPVQSVNGQTGSVTISVPTKTSDLNNDSGFVDAAGAAAAAPVQSVNGQTGAVTLSIPTDTSDLNNDSGFVDAAGAAAAAPVQSVNGQTGAVTVPYDDGKFHVGDSYNCGTGACFYAYLGNNYNGNMYVVLPKSLGSDITGATISFNNVGWIMRQNQALTTNFTISSYALVAGGNQIVVAFTTDITSPQYFMPILINITGLTFTFT